MTQTEIVSLAEAWIAFQHAPKGSTDSESNAWALDLYELEYHDPETLWLLIVEIHQKEIIQFPYSRFCRRDLLKTFSRNTVRSLLIE